MFTIYALEARGVDDSSHNEPPKYVRTYTLYRATTGAGISLTFETEERFEIGDVVRVTEDGHVVRSVR